MITKINHILSLHSTSHILSALDVKHACGANWCVNQFVYIKIEPLTPLKEVSHGRAIIWLRIFGAFLIHENNKELII